MNINWLRFLDVLVHCYLLHASNFTMENIPTTGKLKNNQ